MHSCKYLLMLFILTLMPNYIVAEEYNQYWAKVDPWVKQNLDRGAHTTIFCSFASTEKTLEKVKSETSMLPRKIVAKNLYDQLKELAEKEQGAVLKMIEDFTDYPVKFISLWITNRLFIQNLNWKLASQIINDDNLKSIVFSEHMNPLQANNYTIHQDKENITWGLQKIQVEKAWEMMGGPEKAGAGAVVGIMDSGFTMDHDLINTSVVPDYGWFDPANKSRDIPQDWSGHGTHIAGTILGKNGVGVAPGAKFAACRVCDLHYACPRIYIEQCAQFFICPTKPDGLDMDCSKVVDVVNLSFGNIKANVHWFEAIVDAFQVARIIPVVAAGSGYRACKTIWYPASIKDVLTVSSVTKHDGASDFSSWGPVEGNAYHKPDFVAPGTSIKSASHQGNYYWWTWGTSSAAAHVTGLVAMLRGRYSELRFESMRDLIRQTCDFVHPRWNISCRNVTDYMKPNYMHGYGRINVFRAMDAQSKEITIK